MLPAHGSVHWNTGETQCENYSQNILQKRGHGKLSIPSQNNECLPKT